MSTPAEHATTAEALITTATAPNRITPDAIHLEAQAHALLSRAAGTGQHYTAAETALITAEKMRTAASGGPAHHDAARTALTHAHLATI